MHTAQFIHTTKEMVQQKLKDEGTGHDWFHIWRVWQLAKKIGKAEKANMMVVELAALLHDIADWKQHGGNLIIGGHVAAQWLASLAVDENIIQQVVYIIDNVSYKGAGVTDAMQTLEGKIVQDADRLDAIGSIGIARAFVYGGSKGRPMYDPDISTIDTKNFQIYQKAGLTTINHFYEKLLLIKERLHTATAKKIAAHRHKYMETFLSEFFAQWNGES